MTRVPDGSWVCLGDAQAQSDALAAAWANHCRLAADTARQQAIRDCLAALSHGPIAVREPGVFLLNRDVAIGALLGLLGQGDVCREESTLLRGLSEGEDLWGHR